MGRRAVVLAGVPAGFATVRSAAQRWGEQDVAEPYPPQDWWPDLERLAERVSLMPGGMIDLADIRRWHVEHGFLGGVVLREFDSVDDSWDQPSRLTGTSARMRHECYYLYYAIAGNGERVQQVFIRGTAVPEDMLDNIFVTKVWDEELRCNLHAGFRRRAAKMLENMEPLLDKEATISLYGHSLGGAVATIVGMRLEARGFRVKEVVTFGAPKVMDKAGSSAHAAFASRVVRIVTLDDPVPNLPFGLRTPFTGPFTQMGAQVCLLPREQYYCHVGPREASVPWVNSWFLQARVLHPGCAREVFSMHRMWSYKRLIGACAGPVRAARQVPFGQRWDIAYDLVIAHSC